MKAYPPPTIIVIILRVEDSIKHLALESAATSSQSTDRGAGEEAQEICATENGAVASTDAGVIYEGPNRYGDEEEGCVIPTPLLPSKNNGRL